MAAPSRTDDVTPDSETIVECDSVTREYERGSNGRLDRWRGQRGTSVSALSGVSLRVTPGEVVGIVGPSGSGKSTLLHLVAALDVPTDGTVTLAGEDVGSLSERERTHLRLSTVGMVFQRFHLLPAVSARANVALPLIESGTSKSARRERATALLERVGLADRITHSPAELSGGEQQRVAIARALATDPPLVVADEPTGELDTRTGGQVLDIFEEVASDRRAVVLASHDEATLSRADRIVELRDGERIDR